VKYAVLVGVIVVLPVTRDPLIYPYVEPFWLFGFHGTPMLWVALTLLLVATVFVRNLYCRFLCPVGAFLGVVSKLTVFRIKRWGECKHCRICEKACEWGAIRGPENRPHRVRALRRLRAPIRGHEEVSAPPDHHPEERHPGPSRGWRSGTRRIGESRAPRPSATSGVALSHATRLEPSRSRAQSLPRPMMEVPSARETATCGRTRSGSIRASAASLRLASP
jgi:ferredoxin